MIKEICLFLVCLSICSVIGIQEPETNPLVITENKVDQNPKPDLSGKLVPIKTADSNEKKVDVSISTTETNKIDLEANKNEKSITEKDNKQQEQQQQQQITAPTTNTIQQSTDSQKVPLHPSCKGKSCKPEVTKACKGVVDACRNETECCEIDKCNIWQHVGRDVAVVLVFYAVWCPVSRDFMLPYDLLRAEHEPFNNVLVAKIDADKNPNLVADFGIDEYPTIIFFRRDCYWSDGGCYDPLSWRKYTGASNEFDYVSAWVKEQVSNEMNSNAYKQLPETSEKVTGCKVTKVTNPPDDMRERLVPKI